MVPYLLLLLPPQLFKVLPASARQYDVWDPMLEASASVVYSLGKLHVTTQGPSVAGHAGPAMQALPLAA